MKNDIKTLAVCCIEEFNKLKEEISKTSTEIQLKYHATNYKEALNIINDTSHEIDAIIIDGTLKGENVLSLITNYKDESLLSRTIILDNIKLDCYNLSASNYQLYNVISKDYKINEMRIIVQILLGKKVPYDFYGFNICWKCQ